MKLCRNCRATPLVFGLLLCIVSALVDLGGEVRGEAGMHIAHVTSAPPSHILNTERVLEGVLAGAGMLRAAKNCQQVGICGVSILLVVEEGDLKNPIVEKIQLIDEDNIIQVEEMPMRYASDLEILNLYKHRDSLESLLQGVTVTSPRDLMRVTRRLYPEADTYIHSNPDIIPFENYYVDLVAGHREFLDVGGSVLRTDVYCSGSEQEECQSVLSSLIDSVYRGEENRDGAKGGLEDDIDPYRISDVFDGLETFAQSMPQIHPGHDSIVVSSEIIDCFLEIVSDSFLGSRGVGEAMLRSVKFCSCRQLRNIGYAVAGEHLAFHLGNGKESSWHHVEEHGTDHLYDDVRGLLQSMNVKMLQTMPIDGSGTMKNEVEHLVYVPECHSSEGNESKCLEIGVRR